jgi:hypothetical protein
LPKSVASRLGEQGLLPILAGGKQIRYLLGRDFRTVLVDRHVGQGHV